MKKEKKENLIFKKNFYERVLKKKKDYYEVLLILSIIYSELGQYEKAMEVDKKIIEISPYNPIAYYNLACDYSILGDVEKSAKWLKYAINLGYKDFKYMEKDPDLKNVRKTSLYREILKKVGRALE